MRAGGGGIVLRAGGGHKAMIAVPIAASAPELRAALDAAALPSDDLAEHGRTFFRFDDEGEMIGFGGIESCGDDVLLRSIVMLPEARGKADARLPCCWKNPARQEPGGLSCSRRMPKPFSKRSGSGRSNGPTHPPTF